MIDTIEKYKLFDMTLLMALTIFSEVIGKILSDMYPDAGFYLSFSVLIALITIIRWGYVGALPYVVAGCIMVFLESGNIFDKILLYPVANAFLALTGIYVKKIGVSRIKENSFIALCYVIVGYASVSLGKGITVFFINRTFVEPMVFYFLSNLFNMLMVFIVFMLLKKKEGLLENMSTYLIKNN